jgi:uncharacterized protein
MTPLWPPPVLETITNATYPLLFATISGAHLYGFPSPDSDYDLRGVHILPVREVLQLQPGQETIELYQNQAGVELDLVTHDLKKFCALLLKKNGYVLEQLYSPLIVHTTPAHQELKIIAQGCITRHHSYHYLGFAKTQWRLLTKEAVPRIKPLLYTYRVLLAGIYLMETGEIESNLVTLNQHYQLPQIPALIDRKLAGAEKSVLEHRDLAFHQQEYQRLCQQLETASSRSPLPEKPSAAADLNDFLVRTRLAAAIATSPSDN